MRVALLGFGLIGGSLARALRVATDGGAPGAPFDVVAWSPTVRGTHRALVEGMITEAASTAESAVRGATIVVLAAPPVACMDLLRDLAGPLRKALDRDATITDVASTKARIVELAESLGLRFVGGHPMAGRETSGYESSSADLFVDRPWVVVPARTCRAVDVERVEILADAVRAIPIRLDAAQHDTAVAAISHLPLVLSAALVEAVIGQGTGPDHPDWPLAHRLAASGWRDMTRLARGDVEMGAGIAVTNAAAVVQRLRDVRAALDGWIAEFDAIAGSGSGAAPGPRGSVAVADTAPIAARLRAVKERLERG